MGRKTHHSSCCRCTTKLFSVTATQAVLGPGHTSVRYSPSGTRMFQVLYSMRSSGSSIACNTCASGFAALPVCISRPGRFNGTSQWNARLSMSSLLRQEKGKRWMPTSRGHV